MRDISDIYEDYESERERRNNRRPKCSCCTEPIINYNFAYNFDGDLICPDCMDDNESYDYDEETLTCEGCGDVIEDNFYKVDEYNYCASCIEHYREYI